MSTFENLDRNLPTSLSRNGEVFQALVGRQDAVEKSPIQTSSDFESGALVNELSYLEQYLRRITSQEISDKQDDLLDTLGIFFTGLGRFLGEPDSFYLSRLFSLLRRGGSQTWGTRRSIIGAFSQILPPHFVFYQDAPNWIDSSSNPNLLQNPFFDTDPLVWILSSASLVSGSQFQGKNCLSLEALPSTAKQSLQLGSGYYRLTFAGRSLAPSGALSVFLKNASESHYWDFDQKVFVSTPKGKNFPLIDAWRLFSFDFPSPGVQGLLSLQNASSEPVFVDYMELGKTPEYPSIKLCVVASGQSYDKTLVLSPDSPRDSLNPEYLKNSKRFFSPENSESAAFKNLWQDLSFLGGELSSAISISYLNSLLYFLKPVGVRAEVLKLDKDGQ